MGNEISKERMQNIYVRRNLIASIVTQVLTLAFNLVLKMAIKDNLGVDYLGLQTVYSNFCDIFTFAFAGIGLSFAYRLYKPLEFQNYAEVHALYRFFDKIYNRMSCIVLMVGGVASILLLFVIDESIQDTEIIVSYLIYLLAIVLSNKNSMYIQYIMANQKKYVAWIIAGVTETLFFGIQIPLLYITQNYYLFMFMILIKSILCTVIYVVYIRKNYSYLYVNYSQDIRVQKKEIYSDIKDLIITKIGYIMLNSTDSILISILVSTAIGGLYANYLFVYMGTVQLIDLYFGALTAKIGNYMVTHKKWELYNYFRKQSIINICITGFSTTCFFLLLQDFISVWMGEDAILEQYVVIVLSVNLFLTGLRNITVTYRNASGTFGKISVAYIIRGVVNLFLSVILGRQFGLFGILIATTISNLAVTYVYEAYMVYKYLEKSMINECIYQLLAIVSVFGSIAFTGKCVNIMMYEGLIGFLLKSLLCASVSCVCYLAMLGGIAGLRHLIPDKYSEKGNKR